MTLDRTSTRLKKIGQDLLEYRVYIKQVVPTRLRSKPEKDTDEHRTRRAAAKDANFLDANFYQALTEASFRGILTAGLHRPNPEMI